MAKKKKEIVPANKPMSPKEAQDLANQSRELKKVAPIEFTPDGLNLIALYASENNTTVRGAITEISNRIRELQRLKSADRGVLKTHYSKQLASTSDIATRVAKYFPQGITSIKRMLGEWEAVEQALYSAGILEDADPDLSELRKEIKEKGLNKRSREGKEKIAILEAGGRPAVIGRKKGSSLDPAEFDDLVRDEKAVLPYKYKFNKQALREKASSEVLALNNALTGKAIVDSTKKPTSVDPDFDPSIKSRMQQSARLFAEQLEADQKAGKVPVYTVIGDENPLTPTQALQKRLEDRKEIVPEASTRPQDIIKDLEAKQAEKDERVKNRTLEFLKKGGLKIGKNALPFFGPIAAAVAAYQAGEATASEVERLIDAAEAGLEAAVIPIDATPVASGELPERLRNNTEALQRAMQPQE